MGQKVSKTQIFLLCLLCCVVLFMIVYGLFLWKNDHAIYEEEAEIEEIQDEVITEPSVSPILNSEEETAASAEPAFEDMNLLRQIDFEKLFSINSDVYGWIYIPDTNVDFYIMQEQEVGETYYLWRDIYKKQTAYGSILTPAIPDLGYEDAHLLLFGHHLIDKSQGFSNLKKYVKEDYASSHRYLYLYYPTHSERWVLWTVVKGQADDMVYNVPFELGTDSYTELLQNLAAKGLFTVTDTPDNGHRIVVLSTCDGASGTQNRIYAVFQLDGTYDYQTENYVKEYDDYGTEKTATP